MGELTLAIETSNPSSGGRPGVALGLMRADGVELLGEEAIGEGERHDDLLMPAIAGLMQREGFEPSALRRVVCSVGPGGYTGLRIATAAANMIGLATGARVFGVPSAWVAAAGVASEGAFAVALATKGEASFVTVFGADGVEMVPGRMIGAGEIGELGVGLVLGDRFLPDQIRGECGRLGIRIGAVELSAVKCLGLALRAVEVAVGGLVPMYGREAEAVTRWREIHPKEG